MFFSRVLKEIRCTLVCSLHICAIIQVQNSLKQTLLRGHAKTSIETPKIPAVLNYGLGLKQNLGPAHKSTVNFDIPFAFLSLVRNKLLKE